ncbi:MAG: pyrroloquinoline quinone-dependent dehydrogenase [Acidobacteriota bacterium]|nr:pyrroloquinoline quinone-dependent dehydrogenase [Acidobacteriota bacterium]
MTNDRRLCHLASVLLAAGLMVAAMPAAAQRGASQSQWPAYGGDLGSTRYSPLDQIDGETVRRLRVAWRWDSPDNDIVVAHRGDLSRLPWAFKATPVLVDGTLFIKTSMSQAAAIDARTGETRWVFDPGTWEGVPPTNTGFNARGVAYWSDGRDARVFLPTGDAYLYALDARTGRPVANFGADGAIDATQGLRRPIPRRDYQLMSAPLVVGDVVVIGSVVSDGPRYQLAPPGDVRGFDVRSGEELWEFHTIPQPGEFGNDTWQDGSWRDTGAANAWGSLSADPELGYVYVPTGTPTNDWYGGHRPGDNLFAESIVCLDAKTGERVWHYQFVHHGLWDYDATAAPLLVDLVVGGRPVKAVVVVTKQAYAYVFDRVTGESIWPIEERPVPQSVVPGEQTAPTQPHPTAPPAFDQQGVTIDDLIDFTPELREEAIEILNQFAYGPLFEPPIVATDDQQGTILMPGATGGANWPGAGIDPETGWLYVPSQTRPHVIRLEPADSSRADFRYIRGGGARLQGPQGLPLFKPPYARVTALNLNAGTLAWMTPLGDGPRQQIIAFGLPDPGPMGGGSYTGPLVTKTLLFLGLRGSQAPDLGFESPTPADASPPVLNAYDKAAGTLLHSVELDVPPTGTPMTYMLGDLQYLVVAYGTGDATGLVALTVE